MKAQRKGQRGHLLIEFAVAAAVTTSVVAATIATVISTGKSGREIEVLTQGVSDATAFAAYENILHQLGGPNSNYGAAVPGGPGDLAFDYVGWINRNYAVTPNGMGAAYTLLSATNPWTNGVTNGVLSVGNLGTAYGYNAGNPGPGTFVWSALDAGGGANPMSMTLTYAHAQAFVGLGVPQLNAGAGTGGSPSSDPSTNAEAIQLFLSEDSGTGIVSVSPYYQFGVVDLANDIVGAANANPLAAGVALICGQSGFPQNGSVVLPSNTNANVGLTGTF